MNQRQDLTLSTLIIASMTAYGFLLVWAQNDTIELTTMGDPGGPMSTAGFTIVSGGNVSIDLPPWHSTSIVPAVTTVSTDSPSTAAASLSAATMSPPNRDSSNREGSAASDTTTSGAGGSPAMTDAKLSPAMTDTNVSPATTHRTAGNSIPRSMKTTRDANNFTGRVSLRVKIQSSAERHAAMEMFLNKACTFFLTLSLEDVTVTLGPDRTPMMCLKDP